MTNGRTLPALVGRARCLLLDFDGPICGVFRGQLSAAVAAQALRAVLDAPTPARIDATATNDPIELFRRGAANDPGLAATLEATLTRSERQAVKTAPVTDGARDLIATALQTGRRVAIVSNNSTAAIRGYTQHHALAIDQIVGRQSADPGLLKPDPHLPLLALKLLEIAPSHAVFVGDSPSDIEAGHRAGIPTIGYANKPHKIDRLHDADALISDLGPLRAALQR